MKDNYIEARAAEGLDGLVSKFRDLGINIVGATCILSLENGKVVTLTGGRKDVSNISSILVGILATVEMLESIKVENKETEDLISRLKQSVSHYVHSIDAKTSQSLATNLQKSDSSLH